MNKPSFLIIGGTKCGTTALWYNLDKHPDIYMGTKNDHTLEMHFWGSKTYNNGFDWYYNRFKEDKICGEKSTEYCTQKKCLIELKKHQPETKLIYCVRNPIDRAYSNFQMNKKGGKISEFNYNTFKRNYASAGRYYDKIRNIILPNFNEDQLYICIAEHMKKNTIAEMQKVFDFIGVSDLILPRKEIHGVLLKNRTRQEDIIANRKENYYRVWSKHTEKLKGDLRQKILNYYKSYNKKLFKFLGYEIKEWSK